MAKYVKHEVEEPIEEEFEEYEEVEEVPEEQPQAQQQADPNQFMQVLQGLANALQQIAENQKALNERIETLERQLAEQQGQNLVELLKVVAAQNQQPSIIERLALQSFLENLTTSLAFNKLVQRTIAKKYADVFKEVEEELGSLFGSGNEGEGEG